MDVRRMPPHYVHRKVHEALDDRTYDLLREKERKFRTTLSDHILFAIICDSKKFDKKQNTRGGEENKVEDDLPQDDQFDWTKQKNLADAENEEDKEAKGDKDDEKKKNKDVYAKDKPFAEDVSLLIHSVLHQRNHEYVFFVSDSGSREIGVFIVMIEAL